MASKCPGNPAGSIIIWTSSDPYLVKNYGSADPDPKEFVRIHNTGRKIPYIFWKNTMLAGWTALFLASSRSHQPGPGSQLEEVGGEDGIETSHSFPRVSIKGPKHEIFESGFFYTNQTCTARWLGDWRKNMAFRKLEPLFEGFRYEYLI